MISLAIVTSQTTRQLSSHRRNVDRTDRQGALGERKLNPERQWGRRVRLAELLRRENSGSVESKFFSRFTFNVCTDLVEVGFVR
ncbi:hypothetical protein EVAR_2561_1 [Eumeta japonica]|uniref:Uncharacterized protein n=1 Tax=Eumeta variegata TaxID=151549 RepID=A0A4C1SM73_EUMVA|nr:hypothetical protein EVAR_2561_1 [Eumeta japonica]